MRGVLGDEFGQPYPSDYVIEEYEIDTILGFDDDFDGIVERIDPTTV